MTETTLATSRRHSSWLRSVPFILTIGVGVIGFIGLSRLKKPPETVDRSRPAPLVQTLPVTTSRNELQLVADGEVIPYRQVSLAAQVSGRVIHKEEACRAGQYVREGTLLMTIDPRDYELEVRRIQELIKQMEVNVEETDVERRNSEQLLTLAESDLVLARREEARFESLMAQQATSQSALDTARRTRIQGENAVQTLQNQVRLLDTRRGRYLADKDRLTVELEQAMLNLQRCEVKAPMTGMVTADPVEQNDFVQAGTVLAQIEDTQQVEVRFEMRLDQLRWIWESQGTQPAASPNEPGGGYALPPLQVQAGMDVDGYRYEWDAVLSRYDGAWINPATRTVPCIAIVSNPNAGHWSDSQQVPPSLPGPPTLMRGMYVTVHIHVPATQPLLQIPLVSLRPGNQVWVVRDDQLEVANVKVAQALDQHLILFADLSAIKEGEPVVVSPLNLAVHGMKVRVRAELNAPDSVPATAATETSPTAPKQEIER